MALVLVTLLAVLFPAAVTAGEGACLLVRAVDAQGCGLAGVAIEVRGVGNRLRTDLSGVATLDGLAPGRYSVTVGGGEWVARDTSTTLAAGEARRIAVALQPVFATMEEFEIRAAREAMHVRLSREDIDHSGATSLPDLLQRVTSLSIRDDGTPAGERLASIGGSNPNQVLVRLDGRRLQHSASGEADLSSVPLEWIESVDIFRGGDPVRGGAAIGGIIDITTRNALGNEEMTASLRSHPTYQVASVGRSGSVGGVRSLVSYTRTQGPGDYRYRITEDDGNGEFTNDLCRELHRRNADVERDQFFAKLSSGTGGHGQWTVTVMGDRAERGIPGYLSPRLTPLARQVSGSSSISGAWEESFAGIRWSARGSHEEHSREFEDPDPLSLVHEARESGRQSEIEFAGDGQLRGMKVQSGALATRESFADDRLVNDRVVQKSWSAWASAQQNWLRGTPSAWSVTSSAGLRAERTGKLSAQLLPKVELQCARNGWLHWSASVSWGQSFRPPTFYALFWADDLVAGGNPELQPEKSREWLGQLTVRTTAKHPTEIAAAASDQEVDDLIHWRQGFDGRWKPMNLKSAEIRTLDLRVRQVLFQGLIDLESGILWTEARDGTDDRNTGGKYLTYRSPRTQHVQVVVKEHGFRSLLRYRWVAATPVLAGNSKWLGEYRVLDASVGYEFRVDRLSIRPALEVRNALDDAYRVVRHAPMPLREIVGSVHVRYRP